MSKVQFAKEHTIQMMEFITVDDMSKPPQERVATVWCQTNTLKGFRDFMQYVLDSCNQPETYMILDTKKDLVYDMYKVATEVYGMRKRTFDERIRNVQTGKWADAEFI